MTRLTPLVLLAVLLGGLAACDDGQQPGGDGPDASSPPTTAFQTRSRIEIIDVAAHPVAPHGAAGVPTPPVQRRRVRRFARATETWMNQHLRSLQAGESLGGLRASPLVGGTPPATPGPALQAAIGLAGPERPAASATYRIRVAARGGPEWAQVRAVVTDETGSRHAADFLFEPTGSGPRPVAVGPRPRGRR